MSNPDSNNGRLIDAAGADLTYSSISQAFLGSANYVPIEEGLVVVHAYGDPLTERPEKAKAVLWITDIDPLNATADDVILKKNI